MYTKKLCVVHFTAEILEILDLAQLHWITSDSLRHEQDGGQHFHERKYWYSGSNIHDFFLIIVFITIIYGRTDCKSAASVLVMVWIQTRWQVINWTNADKVIWNRPQWFNSLRPRQNRRHFADDVFKYNFLNENVWVAINISLKFVPKGSINNIPVLVQIMAWRRTGDKPLSEPMMTQFNDAYMRHSASMS